MAETARGVEQLGRQLDPGGAAADERDMDLRVAGRILHHRVRHAEAMVEQPVAETVGLRTLV